MPYESTTNERPRTTQSNWVKNLPFEPREKNNPDRTDAGRPEVPGRLAGPEAVYHLGFVRRVATQRRGDRNRPNNLPRKWITDPDYARYVTYRAPMISPLVNITIGIAENASIQKRHEWSKGGRRRALRPLRPMRSIQPPPVCHLRS